MIRGLDSSVAPLSAAIEAAKSHTYELWAGYFYGPNIAVSSNPWNKADFDNVKARGMTTLAYCSGWADPLKMKAQSISWGVPICLDVEGGIRGDGAWVQDWLDKSGAGLYGNPGVHKGRRAAFYVMADYLGYDPAATWLGYRPPGPCGWQWHGSYNAFGMVVDLNYFDDAFGPKNGGILKDMSFTDAEEKKIVTAADLVYRLFFMFADPATTDTGTADLYKPWTGQGRAQFAALATAIAKIPTSPVNLAPVMTALTGLATQIAGQPAATVDLSPVIAAIEAAKLEIEAQSVKPHIHDVGTTSTNPV